MKKILIILFLIFGFVLGMSKRTNFSYLMINNKSIKVEIVDNEITRSRGLSDRNYLPENQGMLFIFPKIGRYSFWMNDMKFNLDFVFINGNKVVDLVENVHYPKIGESPEVINSRTEFDKVLEMNQGMIGKIGIRIGDLATIKTK